MPGHLFVVQGDARRIACAAWLLPATFTDGLFQVGSTSPSSAIAWKPSRHGLSPRFQTAPERHAYRSVATACVDGRHRWVQGHARRLVRGRAPRVRRGGGRGATRDLEQAPGSPVHRRRTRRQGPRQGDAAADTAETLADEARSANLDIAFVTRDRRAFAAAQAFRRRDPERFWPNLSANLAEIGDHLAEQAAAGSLVAFFGAGISRAAGLPSWSELLGHLATQASLDRAGRARAGGTAARRPRLDPREATRWCGRAPRTDRRARPRRRVHPQPRAARGTADDRVRDHELRRAVRDSRRGGGNRLSYAFRTSRSRAVVSVGF